MTDRTVSQRIKRQRDARLREGWQEVRVWVPTDKDAADVRQLAADRRALAEAALDDLNLGDLPMPIDPEILAAIAEQGSPKYITPSGAILTLMSEQAERGDLAAFSASFTTFARAKPMNAAVVENAAPAKVLNQYLLRHLGLSVDGFDRWQRKNSDWPATIKAALRSPIALAHVVGEMAEGIRQATPAH